MSGVQPLLLAVAALVPLQPTLLTLRSSPSTTLPTLHASRIARAPRIAPTVACAAEESGGTVQDGAALIAEALKDNTTLQVLDLHYNDLDSERVACARSVPPTRARTRVPPPLLTRRRRLTPHRIRKPENRKVHMAFRVGRVIGVWD